MTMLSRFAATGGGITDPYWNNVSLLLNGDGTNGSTTFTDLSSSPKPITNINSVTVNTTTKKFGTGSIDFSGSNYLTTPNSTSLVFGTGDFTIESWFNLKSISDYATIAGLWNGITGYGWLLQVGPSETRLVTTSFAFNVSSWSPSLNTWYFLAVTRSSGSVKIFINGVQIGSTSTNTSNIQSSSPLNIGVVNDGSVFATLNAYLDDLRITKGIARYTANFTPPTAAFPTS